MSPRKPTGKGSRTSAGARLPVEAIKHRKARRKNIPTQELRDFVAEDEARPKAVTFPGLLYARDPSLDPQLVWKGKDEQDRQPLEVPAVPIYIQEKIQPQAIIEEIRRQSRRATPAEQPNLFSDFNGIQFEEMVDFYRHEQNWSNRMILGDSLMVMTSLAEKEGLQGKVQMIYMDPPYGIKFSSNWQVSTRKRDVRDGKAEDLTRQPEQVRAFRDTWKLGIHSYLSYLRDRLVVARELLTESGSLIVQIGDENVHLVRCLLDEVFDAENFCCLIQVQKTGGQAAHLLPVTVDYLLWYAKDKGTVRYRQLYADRPLNDVSLLRYDYIERAHGCERRLTPSELAREKPIPDGRLFQYTSLISSGPSASKQRFDFRGMSFTPKADAHWKTTTAGLGVLARAGRVASAGGTLRYKRYLDDFSVIPITDRWESTQIGTELVYVVQTSTKTVERCMLMTTDPGDLVIDPTGGSGTTAFVAEKWGRRWLSIDTSRVAIALTRSRLMAARYPYYLLADSPEGIRKEAETTGLAAAVLETNPEWDIRKAFVYKRVPHITLKSIANNPEIDAIHARWESQLDSLHHALTLLLKASWREWQIAREAEAEWPDEARRLHAEWWRMRIERQREIDASITRAADVELLYDQPYEDNKRVRVSGPFTVESLSPHRVLAVEEERPASEREASRDPQGAQFEQTILENLRKAGVQNTRRSERLEFDRLDPWPGTWIHAAGEYTDQAGGTRRVAVSIGPEHGTVGSDHVKEAAKEALKGKGFDLLVVCGFAFDAHTAETAKEFNPAETLKEGARAVAERPSVRGDLRLGRLPVMLARMNPDLAMGEELLKKTGAGNLFMVFGEPDVGVESVGDGQLVAEIRGVDVYDPTTGQVRSSSTDDIACWLIDTEYNGESFFVRHAYFTGADQPYDKLKRALRAEIDETAWSALYKTRSMPFSRPASGRIAIKVINHYGDEVLKVFQV